MTALRQPWHIDPSPEMQAAAERGLTFLSHWLPTQIRAPEPEPVAENRDQRIRRRVLAEGVPVKRVALGEGLSVSQVNRIVKQEEAA